MERTATLSSNLTAGNQLTNPISSVVDAAAQTAHKTTDKVADKAAMNIDRSATAVHRAVDNAADAAGTAAEWASATFDQAQQVTTRFTESASASIRARPITAVAAVLIVGYLFGRLARL